MTACPSSTPTADPTRPPPSPDGEAVVAVPHEPATLDPFSVAGQAPATRDVTRLLMPALWRIGPAGERERWLLAEEPVVEEQPRFAVRIRLREDAVWSDGTPITMEDLRFTLRAVMDPETSTGSRDGYDRIHAIEADDERNGRIVFREPFRRWRDLFGAGLGILPAHGGGRSELRRSWPISGGPFVLRDWRRGLDIRLSANPEAWGSGTRLASLRIVFVPDSTSALELLRRGAIDALAGYHSADFARRAREAGATVSTDTGSTWTGLLFNTSFAVTERASVRRAIADSLDRERIGRGVVRDEGTRIDTPLARPVPDVGDAFDPDGDLSRARAALDGAGWRGDGTRRRQGRRLEVTVALSSSDGLARLVANALHEQAARAGIALRPAGIDPDVLWGEWLSGDAFEAAIVTWRDPPGGGLRARLGDGTLARLTDQRLADSLAAADRDVTGDDPWPDAEARVARLAPVIPLYANAVNVATRPGLTGVRASAGADGPLWNAHAWSRAA